MLCLLHLNKRTLYAVLLNSSILVDFFMGNLVNCSKIGIKLSKFEAIYMNINYDKNYFLNKLK